MLFKWLGGKFRLLPWIYNQFPTHKVFVDVFGGSGAVTIHKKPAQVDVYNDIDDGLVNFFDVISKADTLAQFMDRAKYALHSRSLFDRFKKTWQQQTDPVEKAYQWWMVASMSFSGKFAVGGWTVYAAGSANKANEILVFKNRIQLVFDRVKHIHIENKDFRKLIPMYDSQETLFYLDPPYVQATRNTKNAYRCEGDDKLHIDLVNILLKIKGMAILSGYETPIYNPLLDAGWKVLKKQVDVASIGRTKNGSRKHRIECLYTNPAIENAKNRDLVFMGREVQNERTKN